MGQLLASLPFLTYGGSIEGFLSMENYNEKKLSGLDFKAIHDFAEKIQDKNLDSLKRIDFVYLNKDLLFDAAPKDFIIEALKNPKVPTQTKFELAALLSAFNEVTNNLNIEIKDFKRLIIEPKGLHLSSKDCLPDIMIEAILNTRVSEISKLTKDVLDNIVLRTLTEEDYIQPQQGDKLHWLSFMIPDGKVFPYTILRENVLSKYGFPIGLYTKGNEDVDPNSVKYLFYEDPLTKKIMKGIYFEVHEGPGSKGPGGINGITSPVEKPLVIINHLRKEAYFVNFKERAKMPSLSKLISDKFSVIG